jgi:SIR2-like protein
MSTETPVRDVVFLGAGASMASGLPAAGGLTRHLVAARGAAESLRVSPTAIEAMDKDITWLKDIQARLSPIARQLNGFNPENIEDTFRIWGHENSQPKIELPGSLPKLIPGYQYPRLIRMLALALFYCPRYPSVHDLLDDNIYSWLVEQLIGDAEPNARDMCAPVVVTTNYDLLIEFAISARPDADLTYLYREQGGLRNIFNRELTARHTLLYLKLHGSINWWGKRPGFKVSKEVVLDTINCQSPLAAFSERYASAGEDIEMVPPAILKDVIYREVWVDVWDEAYTVFCTCRRLVIIGYSFSQGDSLAHNMIILGLARSPYLESIVVIDPDADAVLARIQGHFSEEFIASKRWTGYAQRFDDSTPQWASRDLLFGFS